MYTYVYFFANLFLFFFHSVFHFSVVLPLLTSCILFISFKNTKPLAFSFCITICETCT
jgi:hypothetical protein